MWDMTFRNCLMDQKRCCIICTCCLAACPEATCYLYWIVGDGRDICGQQDEDGSSILPLGLEVFLCGEVHHLHDDAAAGQHRLVCWACLRPQDGSTATWTHECEMNTGHLDVKLFFKAEIQKEIIRLSLSSWSWYSSFLAMDVHLFDFIFCLTNVCFSSLY